MPNERRRRRDSLKAPGAIRTVALPTPHTKSALAQTALSETQCAAWLATLSAGASTATEREALYDVERCAFPANVVLAAREQGVRALIAREDAGGVGLYVRYITARHDVWIGMSLVPLVLPHVVNRNKPAHFRGFLMLILADELQASQEANKAVYAPAAGQTPMGRRNCTTGGTMSHSLATRLPQSAIDQVKSAAQLIVDDSTDASQVREAAFCSLRAASKPDRKAAGPSPAALVSGGLPSNDTPAHAPRRLH